MKRIVLVISALLYAASFGTELVSFLYAGKPTVGSGRYFGTQSPLEDDSFQLCRDLTEAAHRPLVVLWARNPSGLSALVTALNAEYTSNNAWGVGKKCLFTIFYGSSRNAEKEAYEFVKTHHGDPGDKGVCVCYGVFEDGTPAKPRSAEVPNLATFKGLVNGFVSDFDKEAKDHIDRPPLSNTAFDVAEGRLRAVAGLAQEYVPLIRTNGTETVENTWVEVLYPDGSVTTNGFVWKAGESSTNLAVSLGEKLTHVNDKVWLVLLNTNQLAVATNSITCVAEIDNSLAFPYYHGEVDTLPVGDWSMDTGFIDTSVTNVIALRNLADEANASNDWAVATLAEKTAVYEYAVTNDLANALSVSNATYGAYGDAYASLTNAISAYSTATNNLADALSVSNETDVAYGEAYTALTNAISAYSTATNNLADALSTSNTTYVACGDAYTTLTNAISAYSLATNVFAEALSASADVSVAYDTNQISFDDAATSYDVATNALTVAETVTNGTYGAYGDAYASLTNAISAYSTATNNLADALSVSNETDVAYGEAYTALTNAISAYSIATNNLAEALSTSNMTYAACGDAYTTLTNAISAYTLATNDFAEALSASVNVAKAYDTKQISFDDAATSYDVATNALAVAETVTNETATAEAWSDYTNAVFVVEAVTCVVSNLIAKGEAESGYAVASENYTNAVAAVDTAYSVSTNKFDLMECAEGEKAKAWTGYTNAVAAVDTAYSSSTNRLDLMERAELAKDTAWTDYTNAVEAVSAVTCVVSNLIVKGEAESGYAVASENYTNAVVAVDTAYSVSTNRLDLMERAELAKDTAWTDYTNAVAVVDTAYSVATNRLDLMECAEDENDKAWTGYTNAVAVVDCVQADVDAKLVDKGAAESVAELQADALAQANQAREEAESYNFIVVSGSIVANSEMVNLTNLFSHVKYSNWATSRNIRNIALDCPEDAQAWKGASLLTYAVASNGNSGAYYLSGKGLAAGSFQTESKAAFYAYRRNWGAPGSPEILLVRADGTVAARFTPYVKDGVYSVDENIYRLEEMLAYAVGDRSEIDNDSPETTLLSLAFGGFTETNTLHLSDRVDCFNLSGFPEERPVQVRMDSNSRAGDKPSLSLWRWTDANKTNAVEVEKFARLDDVWYLNPGETTNGLFLKVTAWEEDLEAATRGQDASWFSYSLSAAEAPSMAGEVAFAISQEDGEDLEDVNSGRTGLIRTVTVLGEETVAISVERTGYTGSATATVTLVETNMPDSCYSWTCDANGSTNLTWEANEYGTQTIYINLKDVFWGDGTSNLVFEVSAEGASVGAYASYSLDVVQGTDSDWLTGTLRLTAPMPGVEVYMFAGQSTNVCVERLAGWREGISERGETRGEAIANLSVSGGSLSTNEISWAEYRTGERFVRWTLPENIGSVRSKTYTVDLKGYDCDGAYMVEGASRATVCVVPLWSKEFDTEGTVGSPSGIQYTNYHLELPLKNWSVDENIEIVDLKMNGTLPAGLKVTLDKSAGKIIISGVPTRSATTAVTFQLVLRNGDKAQALTFPTTVHFEIGSLASINPGFDSSRTWSGLPLMGEGRLEGLLDMTVAKNGKMSARYRMANGKTVAFSAAGLSDVDVDTGLVTLGATKKVTSGGEAREYVLSATLAADGALTAEITCDDSSVSTQVPADAVAPATRAADFGGNYVVAFPIADPAKAHSNTLCFGATSMRLKYSTESAWRRGAVTFAGTLPNGKAVSGTAYLAPLEEGAASASVPLFASSSADTFAAMVDIDGVGVAATQDVTSYWSHNEANIETLSYENDLGVIGSVWSWAGWLKGFDGTFNPLRDMGLSFNLNHTSGIAGGTIREDLSGSGKKSTLQWKGVALPGDVPQIIGAYWYSVTVGVGETAKKRTVRSGGLVNMVKE